MSVLPEAVARWVRYQRELGLEEVVLDQPWKPAPQAPASPSRNPTSAGPRPEPTPRDMPVRRPAAPPPPPTDRPSRPAAPASFAPPPLPTRSAPPARPAPQAPAAAPARPATVVRAAFPTFSNLAELQTHALACERCVLAKRRKSVVPSGGPEKADWAILTLYAWAEDLDRKEILAGAYAAPLLELAAAAGLGKPATAAIFACTPDDPSDTTIQGFTEAVRCRGHWLQRLKLSGCKAVLVLDHKATSLARGPSAPVEWPAFRGQRWELDGIPALSTHHPSRMARQAALRPEVEADLKALAAIVRDGA